MSKSVDKSVENRETARTVSKLESRLEQWVYQTIARRGLSVQYRVRGNTLHLLCRKTPVPERTETLLWLIPSLQNTDFSLLLPPEAPQLYQVWLYGCETGDKRPRWTAAIYLNQLDRQLESLQSVAQPALVAVSTPSATPNPQFPIASDTSALTLSNVALAKRGEEMAIACYLSETLNELGVAVRVSAKVIPFTPHATVHQPDTLPLPLTTKRLWIACQAAYSPDASLLCEPITQKLRELEVEGFHDAVILFQVVGENKPDWALRVDLTPPSEMLREWARWGDLEAIQRLLNQDIAALQLQLNTATLNATTLHLCCSSLLPQSANAVIEHHKRVKADIALLLEAIAPQGIHAATLYGQLPDQEAPAWVEWLDLPAAQHPAFADSALTLARQGDWGAIAFLLHRLLNPNLDQYLATGGIQLRLLPKQDLLHVMSEASRCPDRQQVIPVVRFLQQLEIPGIAGVRLYGRRAGQKKPMWSYGADFVSRSRLVPEVTPDFAVTDSYVADLLPQPGEETLRPDLTPEDIHHAWNRWQQSFLQNTQQMLLRSQLFSFAPRSDAATNALPGEAGDNHAYGKKIALIWGFVGLLLMLQSNWLLGQVSRLSKAQTAQTPEKEAVKPVVVVSSATASSSPAKTEVSSPPTKSANQSANQPETSVFNSSSFTQLDTPEEKDKSTNLAYTPRSQAATLITAEILAEPSPLPSFNSHQLDEKLQLYYRYLEKFGTPDVLVVGSSRALRGVDSVALENALAKAGYADAKVFNFGVNGATAQVVNLLVQHILTPEQLPRLILWADGARAFNSGTPDVTYNGIVASPAYQQLLAGTLPIPSQAEAAETLLANDKQPSLNTSLTSSYQSIDRWLSQQLAAISGRETDRDQIKHQLQQGFTALLPGDSASKTLTPTAQASDSASKILQTEQVLPDETGFLSLPLQFNPATYYQKYARVLGIYDSDYEDFDIQGNQEKALQSLLKFTHANAIPVVFVNLPLTEDYLDPVRADYEQEFRDYMVQFALSTPGFVFRDLGEQWTTKYNYFSDPSHLNRYGAHAVSIKLTQDAKIPWRKSLRSAAKANTTKDEG